MSVWAAILMAGSGSRFGGDKTAQIVRGKPLWRYSFDALLAHPDVDGVGIVCSADRLDAIRSQAPEAGFIVEGGTDRMSSSRRAVEAMPESAEIALIHDAARPMVFADVVSSVIEAARRSGGAAPAVDCIDTVRMVEKNGERLLLDRRTIKLMQTPQGAKVSLLRGAYDAPGVATATDEMALLEAIDVRPELVEGRPESFKVTFPADLARFAGLLGVPETRTGIGYDTHVFTQDPERELWLGGVRFEGERGLEGHSDADAVLHAVTDALLGAAALGDIGQAFPNDDPEWKNRASTHFVQYASQRLGQQGWQIRNIDVTVIAEFPKIMPNAQAMREAIASAAGVDVGRVAIKATTNERMGAIGRGEGVAAFAIATIVQFP